MYIYIYIYISVQEPDKFFILYLYPYLSYICLQPLQRRTCYKLLPWVRFREPNRKNATEGFGGQRVVGWLGGWMDGWVVGWVRVFLISRSVRSRMFPAWPRMLPSCAPQVPPMSLVCRPQVLRMFQHVPCERFACSLLHPHVLPYVPACSRVFPACSPHDLCILHACSPHVPCMFPACARMFPACARVFPTCSQHVPRIFPPCSLHVPFLFFEPRQVFG